MTDLEIERVRRLIAEASAKSAQRHSEFTGQCCDLWQEMSAFWQSQAPVGTKLPDDLVARANALLEQHS